MKLSENYDNTNRLRGLIWKHIMADIEPTDDEITDAFAKGWAPIRETDEKYYELLLDNMPLRKIYEHYLKMTVQEILMHSESERR